MKKKIHIEYPIKPTSISVIWSAVSTPAGLQGWFADKISKSDKHYTFQWGKSEYRYAEITNMRNEYFIRFHWCDEEPKTYFEFKILYDELTNDHMLQITDFVDPDEESDVISLWDSQIDALKRTCGL